MAEAEKTPEQKRRDSAAIRFNTIVQRCATKEEPIASVLEGLVTFSATWLGAVASDLSGILDSSTAFLRGIVIHEKNLRRYAIAVEPHGFIRSDDGGKVWTVIQPADVVEFTPEGDAIALVLAVLRSTAAKLDERKLADVGTTLRAAGKTLDHV